jgi:hypothetical protein
LFPHPEIPYWDPSPFSQVQFAELRVDWLNSSDQVRWYPSGASIEEEESVLEEEVEEDSGSFEEVEEEPLSEDREEEESSSLSDFPVLLMPDDEEDSLFGQEKEISQEQRISDKGKARIQSRQRQLLLTRPAIPSRPESSSLSSFPLLRKMPKSVLLPGLLPTLLLPKSTSRELLLPRPLELLLSR